jgi:uncharacterized C2H2 Zn-finger protein
MIIIYLFLTDEVYYSHVQNVAKFHYISLKKKSIFLSAASASFLCDICGVTLKSRKGCRDHIAKMHGNANFMCTVPHCGKIFTSRTHYKSHVLSHAHVSLKYSKKFYMLKGWVNVYMKSIIIYLELNQPINSATVAILHKIRDGCGYIVRTYSFMHSRSCKVYQFVTNCSKRRTEVTVLFVGSVSFISKEGGVVTFCIVIPVFLYVYMYLNK